MLAVYDFAERNEAFDMTQFGRVTAYDPETHIATITFIRPEACEKCGACTGRKHHGEVRLRADCAVGQWVRVELPEGRFLQATFLAYICPLVGLLAGLALGHWLGGGADGATLLGGALGLGLPLAALALLDRRLRKDARWQPVVSEVYDAQPTGETIGCSSEKR